MDLNLWPGIFSCKGVNVFLIEDDDFKISWDGRATVHVSDNGFSVAVDPNTDASTDFEADIILVTHQDSEHFDLEALEQVSYSRTVLVLPESMRDVDVPVDDVEYISSKERIEVYTVEIEAFPMTNEFHERGQGFSYRFVMGSKGFYVAGDTGVFDDVLELEGKVDYAFLPVNDHSMSVDEASKMAAKVKPRITVPYHYQDADIRSFRLELERRNLEVEVEDLE